MDLDLRHLRAFAALAQHRNFTRAAAAVGVSQPALTRTVQQLERILGQDLVTRTSRSAVLTDAGHEFAGHCRRILADVEAVADGMRAQITVRVGFAWLLPEWVGVATGRFESAGDRVEIRRSDDPVADLVAAVVDVAVSRRAVGDHDGLVARPMAVENRVLAVGATSELVTRPGLRWDDLAGEPVVVNVASGTTGPDSWQHPDPNRRVVRCNNFDEWLELTAAGRGVSAVPDMICDRITHPGVAFRRIPGVPPSTVWIAWRRGGGRARAVDRLLHELVRAAPRPRPLPPDCGEIRRVSRASHDRNAPATPQP